MADRDEPDGDIDKPVADIDEPAADIQKLLLSPVQAEREAGYAMSDEHYGPPVRGFVRRTYEINADDGDDVWQATMDGLRQMVEGRRFQARRKLAPLLFAIARRKAKDLQREQWTRRERRSEQVYRAGKPDDHPHTLRELRDAVLKAFRGEVDFTGWEWLVLANWLKYYYDEAYPPSPAVLTDELFGPVNEQVFGSRILLNEIAQKKLTDRVRKGLERAMVKLRDHLIRMNYWKSR